MSKNQKRAEKFQAIHRELEALREREWRHRRGDFHLEFAPTPISDPRLSSRLYGPDMKSVQWKRE